MFKVGDKVRYLMTKRLWEAEVNGYDVKVHPGAIGVVDRENCYGTLFPYRVCSVRWRDEPRTSILCNENCLELYTGIAENVKKENLSFWDKWAL